MSVPVRATLEETPHGLRIFTESPWHSLAAIEAKEIPGAKWDKASRRWRYNATMAVCRQLRKVYGDRLTISPALSDWAWDQRKLEEETEHLSKVHDSSLRLVPLLAPEMNIAMAKRTYQRSGAKFIQVTRSGGLLDEPGLGKTATSIAGVIEAGLWRHDKRILVIAPKTAAGSTWPAEIEKWTFGSNTHMVSHGSTAKNNAAIADALSSQSGNGPTIVVVNFEMLRVRKDDWCHKCKVWMSDMAPGPSHYTDNHKTQYLVKETKHPMLFETEWDAIIADECHRYLLNVRPNNKKIPQVAHGAMSLRVAEGGLRIPMTGTPFRGKEQSLFGILHWTDPKVFTSYWNWVDLYLQKTSNGYGVIVGGVKPEMEEEFGRMMSRYFLRRTRAEVRPELPDQTIIDEWVELSGKHKKQYSEFEASGVADLESGAFESIGVLSELTRLRQFSYGTWMEDESAGLIPQESEKGGISPKLDRILEILDEKGIDDSNDESAPKVIIASQFTRIVNHVAGALDRRGIKTMEITGHVTGEERTRNVEMFNSPHGPRVMLMNTKAGGESITLDAYCDEMIILDETFVEDDQVQLRGRIDNRGDNIRPRFYRYIRTRGTIEEAIAKSNVKQHGMQSKLLDKRRGAETAVRLIKGLEV